MNNAARVAVLSSFFFLVAGGCNEPFTPQAPFKEQLVVYGILTEYSDTQYVRLHRTYNPPDYDPYKRTEDLAVPNAVVEVSDGVTMYQFVDTILVRQDKSRYTSDILAYIAFPFRILAGRRYTLFVQTSEGLSATAEMNVPRSGFVSVQSLTSVFRPGRSDVVAFADLGEFTAGYIVRFFINYEVFENSAWVAKKLEIPVSISYPGTAAESINYPVLVRRSTGESQAFQKDAYKEILYRLVGEIVNAGKTYRFTTAVFTSTQVENHLYDYYNVASGFRDPYSIRSDLPNYTNIVGGVGVFGSFVEDSLVIVLPNTFPSPP